MTYQNPEKLFNSINLYNWIVYKVIKQYKDEIEYVLSIGEGNCAWIAKLALAFPDIQFHAYDIDPKLCEIGKKFLESKGIKNVYVYCSNEPKDLGVNYDLAYARNVLQLIDRDDIVSIVNKAGAKIFVVDWYPNMPWYLLIRLMQSIYCRNKKIFLDTILSVSSYPKKIVNLGYLENIFRELNYDIIYKGYMDYKAICYLVAKKS